MPLGRRERPARADAVGSATTAPRCPSCARDRTPGWTTRRAVLRPAQLTSAGTITERNDASGGSALVSQSLHEHDLMKPVGRRARSAIFTTS
jgi:hypothetical protein